MTSPPARPLHTLFTLTAVAVLAAALAVACGTEAADEPDTSTSDETHTTEPAMFQLAPGTYRSESVTGRDLVPGSTITLHVEDQQVSANAGCNTLAGEYALEGDVFVLPHELRSTLMGCDQPLMDQDSWLGTFLSSRPTWALDGTRLTLTFGDVAVVLVREVEDTVPGPGGVLGSWELDTVIDGETASNVPSDVPTPTLEFTEGQLTVFTGCNSGGASVTVDADAIAVGPLRLTRKACGSPAMQIEARVATLLDGDVPYRLDGDRLTLGPEDAALIWRRA